jgi:hypothetical protein
MMPLLSANILTVLLMKKLKFIGSQLESALRQAEDSIRVA